MVSQKTGIYFIENLLNKKFLYKIIFVINVNFEYYLQPLITVVVSDGIRTFFVAGISDNVSYNKAVSFMSTLFDPINVHTLHFLRSHD